ncbi:MAG: hypothetical protein ABW095_14535, partial [Candidatus Thiodiazotropha sp.]
RLRHVGFPVSPRDYRGLTASAFSLPWRSVIVVEHGGEIRLESDIGEGACFTFTWPRKGNQERITSSPPTE